jgi:hypothetical protein
VPSATYALLRKAIVGEKQVTCTYGGYRRELCPVVLGHTKGQEVVLAYQFGGSSRSGLPRAGEWRCLAVSGVRDARLREGPWHEGSGHQKTQSCVEVVDIDVNIQVRKLRR